MLLSSALFFLICEENTAFNVRKIPLKISMKTVSYTLFKAPMKPSISSRGYLFIFCSLHSKKHAGNIPCLLTIYIKKMVSELQQIPNYLRYCLRSEF